MPEILMLNSCVHRDRVNNVGFVPQIPSTDGKVTADITKTYSLSGTSASFQCRNDEDCGWVHVTLRIQPMSEAWEA
jgi:hypothetical protein